MAFDPSIAVAIDTETTGLYAYKGDRPFAVGMCDYSGNTWYCEWPVDPFTRKVTPDQDDLDFIQDILDDESVKKVYHNAMFDVRMLQWIGLNIDDQKLSKHNFGETLIAARVCSTSEFVYGLKPLAKKYAGYPDSDEKMLKDNTLIARRWGKRQGWKIMPNTRDYPADYWTLRAVDSENDLCEAYCRGDVIRTMILYRMFVETIMEQEPSYKRTYEWELKLWPMVYGMTTRGVRIDQEVLDRERNICLERKERYQKDCWEVAKEFGFGEINLNSHKKVADLLYEAMNLTPEVVSKKTGKGSVSKKAFRTTPNPFVRSLLGFKANNKAVNDFFNKYERMSSPDSEGSDTLVLHPGFNQVGTKTGRFSCSDPNLQQVPNADSAVEGMEKIQARAPFGPRPGYLWYAADYSQMELRMFADISGEPLMREAILGGRDIMTEVANKVWGGKNNPAGIRTAAIALEMNTLNIPRPEILDAWRLIGWNLEKADKLGFCDEAFMLAETWLSTFDYNITKAEASLGKKTTRGRAKMCTYAKTYGGGPNSVMGLMYCSHAEAKQFLKDLDTAFPYIVSYMRETIQKARMDGYIVTRYGRKLAVIPQLAYKAVNYQVQGAASDLMKNALWNVHNYFKETGLDAHNVMTIHDELVFEVRADHSYKWLLRGVKTMMEDTGDLFSLPITVEMKKARQRWDVKEKVEL